jgi:hypothetical protein
MRGGGELPIAPVRNPAAGWTAEGVLQPHDPLQRQGFWVAQVSSEPMLHASIFPFPLGYDP